MSHAFVIGNVLNISEHLNRNLISHRPDIAYHCCTGSNFVPKSLFLSLKAVLCTILLLHNRVVRVLPEPTVRPMKTPDTFVHILLRFVRCLSVSACWDFESSTISHHAPLCCLWIHSVRIVKYVQCFSVVQRRQSVLDLFMSGAGDVFKDREF